MLFKEIIGQEATKAQLRQAVREGRIPHAQLFTGISGIGKLQLALAYAQYLNCPNRTDEDSCGRCPTCLQYQHLQHPDLHFVFPIVKTDSADTCNDFLEKAPSTAKAFLEATAKGYEYAAEHPKEAADMLIEGDSTGSLRGAEDLVYASQEWLSKEYIADSSQWGVFDEARWNAFYKWLADHDLTVHDLSGTGFTNAYLPEE